MAGEGGEDAAKEEESGSCRELCFFWLCSFSRVVVVVVVVSVCFSTQPEKERRGAWGNGPSRVYRSETNHHFTFERLCVIISYQQQFIIQTLRGIFLRTHTVVVVAVAYKCLNLKMSQVSRLMEKKIGDKDTIAVCSDDSIQQAV